MKIIWEVEDISKFLGRTVYKKSSPHKKFIVGFDPSCSSQTYCLISLDDGMVCCKNSKEELAKGLNDWGYVFDI